ncbi:hypothetical protein LINGRAHAP2_LOCUS23399, partial [Linum grandiflorum]
HPHRDYDSSAQHFFIRSLGNRRIVSVSDAGVVATLISDPSLPPNSTILGLAIDRVNNRLLTVVQSLPLLPIFNTLASYDLKSRRCLFLSLLPDTDTSSSHRLMAIDFKGNTYITKSVGITNLVFEIFHRPDLSKKTINFSLIHG